MSCHYFRLSFNYSLSHFVVKFAFLLTVCQSFNGIHYHIETLLKYGQETEQRIFKFETARKVGSSGLVR